MDTRTRPRTVLTSRVRIFGLFLLGLAPACTRTTSGEASQLQQADQAYRAGRYAEVERITDRYLASSAFSPDAAEAYYLRALSKLKRNQRSQARSDLTRGLDAAPRAPARGRINAQLGHIAFDDARYSLARSYFSAALGDLPPRPPADDVLYHLAVAYQRDGQFQKARPLLAEVVSRFPSSRWASRARQKSDWPNEFFTVQCGAFVGRSAALRAAGHLRSRNIVATVVKTPGQSLHHHIVCAGRYTTYQEAARALQRIRRVQGDAFIVP